MQKIAAILTVLLATGAALAQETVPATDIPLRFVPTAPVPAPKPTPLPPAAPATADYILREVMIPTRDGARLHTIIIMAKGIRAAPIVLFRTPYGIADAFKRGAPTLDALLGEGRNVKAMTQAGYVIAMQDIRGRFGSDGDYRLLRPLHGTALNPTAVDESTDAWDTIDWLVKNVPESNQRVATMGGSYGGFTTLMSEIDPHPALKAAVPVSAVADVWTGDDLFHHGAFRQTYLDWVYSLVSDKASRLPWPEPRHDAYDTWLTAGSAGAAARAQGMDGLPYWQRVVAHPAYDAYWREQAVDRLLAARPATVPTLTVHSQWDQEDIYGPLAAYRALEAKDTRNDRNFLVIGPWKHGGAGPDGKSLGPLEYGTDTGDTFRRTVLIPFLDRYLKPGGTGVPIAPVTVFETGTNRWRSADHWPLACDTGCAAPMRSLYLQPGGRLAFAPPPTQGAAFDAYVSDPAKPVTYRTRPIRPTYAEDSTWGRWLVDDQRFAADRPDVLTYTTDVLTAPVHIAGSPVAHLVASTSAEDADFVVKMIDVYPDTYPAKAELGGYQLPISMDIVRARYRNDPALPVRMPSNMPVAVAVPLPTADHVFLPGHRIMVQVQSSWFPLYDRNPQKWVDNIFNAQPADYVAATHRVYHAPGKASYVALPVVP